MASDDHLTMINQQKSTSIEVIIDSAVPLSAVEKEQLEKYLRYNLADNLLLKYQVKKSLLAGIRIMIGDEIIDTTVKYQLNEIKKHLLT